MIPIHLASRTRLPTRITSLPGPACSLPLSAVPFGGFCCGWPTTSLEKSRPKSIKVLSRALKGGVSEFWSFTVEFYCFLFLIETTGSARRLLAAWRQHRTPCPSHAFQQQQPSFSLRNDFDVKYEAVVGMDSEVPHTVFTNLYNYYYRSPANSSAVE